MTNDTYAAAAIRNGVMDADTLNPERVQRGLLLLEREELEKKAHELRRQLGRHVFGLEMVVSELKREDRAFRAENQWQEQPYPDNILHSEDIPKLWDELNDTIRCLHAVNEQLG